MPEPLTSEAPRPLTSRRPGTREKGQTRRAADRDPHGPRSRAEPWAAMRRGRWSWTRPGPVGRGARAWCRGEPAARAVARFPVSGGSQAQLQKHRTVGREVVDARGPGECGEGLPWSGQGSASFSRMRFRAGGLGPLSQPLHSETRGRSGPGSSNGTAARDAEI